MGMMQPMAGGFGGNGYGQPMMGGMVRRLRLGLCVWMCVCVDVDVCATQ
jgi:hypothetical protein